MFTPSRLLHGVIPSALLEAFHIWQGEDDLLRGTPIEEGSQWFNYKLEMSLSKRDPIAKGEENLVATVVRRPLYTPATKIKSASSGVPKSALLCESGMRIQSDMEDKEKLVFESSVRELTTLEYPPAACRLALRKNENIMEMAASWLLDENNLPDIMAAAMMDESGQGHITTNDRQSYLPVLESEGFSHTAAQYALDLMGGDLNLAKSWLLDEANQEQIEMLSEMKRCSVS
jgi:hypothetical protein